VEDDKHPRHKQAMDYYRECDKFIKEMWERHHATVDVSKEGDGFFLLSDHGFCGIEQEFYLNVWLREQGYLKFDKDPPESMKDISAEARAFALDPGRIYLHREGKYPKGRVKAEEGEKILAEIKEKLLSLKHNGRPVIEMVKTREEAYQGPESANGPDLVVTGHHGFDLKGMLKAPAAFGRSDLTGMHTWDDAFFWSREPAGADLEITQLAGIVTRPLFE
jgi:predicted AlkP superfamily phosphohydrolase/phosphomutase